MAKGKNIIITGGAGFIGSRICERLVGNNTVTIYDNFKRDALRFTALRKNKNLRIIEGDVLDGAKLEDAMCGADIVIHCAAVAGIYSVGVNAGQTIKVNFLGLYNALESAVRKNVKLFMDFSTSEVYGPFVFRGKESDSTTLGPVGEKRWIYAVSKLAGEHLAHTYSEEHGLGVVTIRPFNIYGPGQVGDGAVKEMVTKALRGAPITVYNDGTQIRAWCYIDDFIDAVIAALEEKRAVGEVINIGNPREAVTVLQLAEEIRRRTGLQPDILFREHPGPEVQMRIPDIGKAGKLLGFSPRVSLGEGLDRSIAWYNKHLEQI
ncbi:MAG: NAD-dependent epimerase/dehydratase family protein [Candidatus Tritonobacter lacicola]|nr:NAD-dependent epimerase/dehydratase family protein [Candidatus Tritonobacter lacicola]